MKSKVPNNLNVCFLAVFITHTLRKFGFSHSKAHNTTSPDKVSLDAIFLKFSMPDDHPTHPTPKAIQKPDPLPPQAP